MRGTKSITHGSSTDPRITPACARNRPFMYVAGYGMKGHPRVCGEQKHVLRVQADLRKLHRIFGYRVQQGSPPRVRGTDLFQHRAAKPGRITPACAGNSAGLPARAADPGDHPRVCGEQAGAEGAEERFGGSPPRVRGTEMHGMYQRFHIGITPACAGNRNSFLRIPGNNKDHPRVCGEQALAMRKILCSIGSPPRVRGTGTPLRAEDHRDGITPACAGNSPPRSPA